MTKIPSVEEAVVGDWEEEFRDLYEDLDYPVCCSERDCACNKQSVLENIRIYITTLLAAKDREIEEAIAEESERMVVEVIKVIVSEYKSATNSYKIAKMNVEKGKKWAEADCISENSKQVVLSRLEPKISNLLSSLDTLLTDKE